MSEELFSETDHLTFNEEDFNNLQSALMLKESECIVESQQSTNLSDDGLLKVLSFDSEVNISTTLADQSVNSSSQSCKETTTKVKKSVLKTYKRKGKRKIEVAPKVIKRSGRKKIFSGNNSKSDENSKSPQIKNQNIGKKSEIQKSECRLDDEEDEYTLNKIRKNMFDYSGSRDDREKSVNSDNVSTETVIRKRGRPKKTISVTEKTKNISKNNKSIVTCEESQGTIGKVTCKAGRPPKKKNVKVYVESTCSTTEPAIESSVLQSTNVDCINKFNNLQDFDELVVEDLKKNPGALGDDKNYSNNKISNSDHNKLNEAPTEVKEQINKVQLDLSNDDSNNGNSTKRPSRMPEMPDFEYNVDSIDREYSNKAIKGRLSDTENQKQNTCSTTETSCGRPQRRKVKHNLRYDECSDEDPFANVEISDDDGEPIGFKKGNKYYSDDEYIPIKKLKKVSESFTSDSDIEKNVDELKKPRKKRKNIKTKKNEKTPNVDTIQKDTNKSEATIFTHTENSQHSENNELYSINQHKRSILDGEQSSIIESEPEEIENYLAKKIQGSNLKIKRVSNIKPTAITPIDIPVIDSYTAKKSIDAWSQTNILKMNSTSVQTMTACDLGMKTNVPLSAKQREKACEFLKDTVKTISELGELMTQKSEDFIQKKINTKHIIDTFKMDYCVRKSFLMLNLVKHNIMEIEENLAKQDEDFLRENNLLQYREVPKSITPTLILSENDSDCEIIEESSESNSNQSKEKPQPKLNLKTVFLNKELSIKIAKKPSKEQKSREKINIEGKNTVWISDSVLLKKINTKQSFLAQDSRNKKPPDKYVTNEMVSDFFKNYYHQIVSTICAPFISSEWCDLKKINNWCYHFCAEPLKLNNTVKDVNVECNTNENNYIVNSINTKTLLLICVEALQKNMYYLMKKSIRFEGIKPNNYYITDVTDDNKPLKLSLLCIQKIRNMLDKQNVKTISTSKSIKNSYTIVRPLKMLCYNKIIQIFYSSNQDKIKKIQSNRIIVNYPKFRPVKSLVSRSIGYPNVNSHDKSQKKRNNQLQHSTPRSLKQITYYSIVHLMIKHVQQNDVHLNDNKDDKYVSLTTNVQLAENNDRLKNNTPKSLKHIAYSVIDHTMMRGKKSNGVHLNANKYDKHVGLPTNVQFVENNDQLENHTPKALKQITYSYIVHLIMKLEQQSASKNDKHVNLRTHVQLTENNDQLKNNTPKSLKHIAYSVIDHTMTRGKKSNGVHLNADKNDKHENLPTNVQFIENNDQLGNNTPKALKQITYSSIVHLIIKLEQQSALHLSASKNDKHVNLRTNVQLTEINDQLENHTPRSLKQITYYSIVHLMIKHVQQNDVHLNDNKDDKHVNLPTNIQLKENNDQLKNNIPKSLKHITYIHMKQFMCHNKNILITNDYKNKFNVRSKNYMKQVIQQSHKKSEKIVDSELCGPELAQVKSLFKICSEKILLIISHNKEAIFDGVHINCANTVPEEMFLNFKNHSLNSKDVIFDTEDLNIQDEYFIENDYDKKTLFQEYNCEYKQNLKDASHCLNQIVNDSNLEQGENINFLSQIKTEAVDNVNLNDGVELFIKTELDESFEEKNIMPQIDNKQLKHENNFNSYAIMTEKPVNFCTEYNISKFDNLQYEKQTMCSNSNTEQVVFSQSSSRVRKQFEPDSDNENDNTMSLLIPQAYETLPTETSHSARKLICIPKNTSCKKKCDKRKIKKKSLSTKKSFERQEELVSIKEINKLTENKTTDEEEKSQSSDSDTVINMPLVKRIKRMRKCTKDLKKQRIIIPENEIQCNNVDSTQNVSKNSEVISHNDKSAADCSDVNSNRHVEHNTFINDTLKIKSLTDNSDLRKESSVTDKLQYDEEAQDSEQSFSPVVNLEESVELLGCVPDVSTIAYNIRKREDFSTCEYNMESIKSVEDDPCNNENESDFRSIPNNLKWQYHSINRNDAKLYQEAVVVLEKLPDLFVKTCLQLQASAEKNKGVIEVESLKLKTLVEQNNEVIGGCTDTDVPVQESKTILFDSRDLNDDISNDGELDGFSNKLNMEISEKIVASCAVSKEQTVDKKSTLKEKTDISLEKIDYDVQIKSSVHLKTLDKCADENENLKSKIKETNDDNLIMLTADKVMKKDLKLLNEPVLVHHEYNDTTSCTDVNKKHPPKKLKRCTTKDGTSVEDRSSSEEEKQWVNTKEKLLKRLVKKQEDSRLDYAKEAKIVSEFIEKCEAPETRKRYRRNCSMRVQKNITELKHQLSNLNNERFGENSEPSHSFGKKGFQSFSKGRRDIRKGTEASEIFEVTKHLKSQNDKHNEVIDKKSLARSTVIANMEENERKRRLHQRQTALKERLGCEENVNVVVINDELCLEYDFEENMPVVSIHNFYTTVMKAHQYEGVKFMWDSCFDTLASIEAGHAGGGCILAHCMGLGKTLQVLALLHTVLTHPRVNMQRVLVCCPLSTVLNWVDEIHKWMRPVTDKIKVFELSKLKKIHERAYQLEDWYKGGGIFIIGYELFRNLTTLDPFTDNIRPTIINKIRTALLEPGPDIIICDEGHLLKNDCSVLAEAMSMVTTKRRIVLTGTPMQNNLREYYCMVNFVKPNLLGRYSEYSNRFENPIMNGQHRDSREEDIKLMKARTHILHKVLEGVLQRQEASVLYPYLPKKHEYTVFIPLSKCQCDLYKHYLIHYTQNKHNTLKDFNILQKIWSHPQVLHNFYLKTRDENSSKVKVEKLEDDLAREDLTASEDITPSQTEMWWMRYLDGDNLLNTLESSNKFLTVFRILEECIAVDDKVLLFSTSLFTMDTLEYFLKKINNWSLGREYYRLDGSVPAEVRQKWCREFNAEINKTTKLFLMSTRAGSLGLNMTAANRVIIFDTSWNPAHDIQSIFRVYRFGQKKDCYIYRLVALGTMEQKIYERSVTKQAVSCRVVDEQQIDRHYNMDELNELYKLDETGAGVACGVSVGVTDVALLRVARDAPLYAVHEHDSLLRGSEEQQLPEDERAAAWRQFEQEQEDKQLENLGKSLQKTTIERPYESDFTPSSSISLDTKKEVKEYISEANTINQNNEIKDCTFVEKDPVQNIEHSGEGTDEAKVKQIKENSKDKNIPRNFRKVNIEEIVNKMKNIIKAQMQNFSHSNNDTSRNNIKTPLIQSTSKDITTSIVQTTKENLVDYKALDTCSKTEMNNKTNKSNNDLNKNEHKTDGNNQKRFCNDKENLSDAQTAESTLTVAEKKKTNERSLDLEKKLSGDEDDVWCVEDDNSNLAVTLNEQKENNTQATNHDNKVILLSDVETITDDEEPSQNITPTPENITSGAANKDNAPGISCILLSDDDDDDIIMNTNQIEKIQSVDILECNDEKINNDDNEKTCLPKSLLTNEIFIKVVAHIYLAKNPTLDKEGALLAARYSAKKAFIETCKTGKGLCSGPLYDIAVNIVGKDILKKIQKQNKGKPAVINLDKVKAKCDHQAKDLANLNQTNIDLTSDDESLTKTNKSQEITIKKGTVRKRVRERLGSSSSDDLIMISDEPKITKRTKIIARAKTVSDPLAIKKSYAKDTVLNRKSKGVEVPSESPSASGKAVSVKKSTSRVKRNSSIPVTASASDNKARSSSCTNSSKAKKRKKNNFRMTLEDFDIDDIDNIIELE